MKKARLFMVVAVLAAIGGALTTNSTNAANKSFFNAKDALCNPINSECGQGTDPCQQVYDLPTCSVLQKRTP